MASYRQSSGSSAADPQLQQGDAESTSAQQRSVAPKTILFMEDVTAVTIPTPLVAARVFASSVIYSLAIPLVMKNPAVLEFQLKLIKEKYCYYIKGIEEEINNHYLLIPFFFFFYFQATHSFRKK